MARDIPGTVYLLHLDPPYKHARHYLGWASDLAARLAEHEHGLGARLLAVQKAAGGTWHLARTWPGATRTDERRIKDTGHVPHYCPDCQPGRSAARRTARQATTERTPEMTHQFSQADTHERYMARVAARRELGLDPEPPPGTPGFVSDWNAPIATPQELAAVSAAPLHVHQLDMSHAPAWHQMVPDREAG